MRGLELLNLLGHYFKTVCEYGTNQFPKEFHAFKM